MVVKFISIVLPPWLERLAIVLLESGDVLDLCCHQLVMSAIQRYFCMCL